MRPPEAQSHRGSGVCVEEWLSVDPLPSLPNLVADFIIDRDRVQMQTQAQLRHDAYRAQMQTQTHRNQGGSSSEAWP